MASDNNRLSKPLSSALLGDPAQLDSAAVSDALDGLGHPAGVGGITPVRGHPELVGRAVTITLGPHDGSAPDAHIATGGDHGVIVVANAARTDAATEVLEQARGIVARERAIAENLRREVPLRDTRPAGREADGTGPASWGEDLLSGSSRRFPCSPPRW